MTKNTHHRALVHLRALCATLALLAAAGCEGPTSPVRMGDLEIAFGAIEFNPIDARAAVTSTAPGRISIGGRIPTGDPCQDLVGESELVGRVLTLRITATQREGGCIAVVAVHPYFAVQHGVAPGSYRVRVEHAYRNTGWANTVVLDTTVVVP